MNRKKLYKLEIKQLNILMKRIKKHGCGNCINLEECWCKIESWINVLIRALNCDCSSYKIKQEPMVYMYPSYKLCRKGVSK